ncbi:hypothetical protein Tsubulata_050608, partial [Turnera subulata]
NRIITKDAVSRAGSLKDQTSSLSELKSLKLLVQKSKRGCGSFDLKNTGALKVPEEITAYLLSGTPRPQNVDIIIDCLSYYDAED